MKALPPLLFLLLLGVVIVALPDSDDRLFSFSQGHGPSLQDAVGLVFILIPYAFLVRKAWGSRENVRRYRQSRLFDAGLLLAGLGTGLIIASVANDLLYWWGYGIVLLVALQAVVFFLALK